MNANGEIFEVQRMDGALLLTPVRESPRVRVSGNPARGAPDRQRSVGPLGGGGSWPYRLPGLDGPGRTHSAVPAGRGRGGQVAFCNVSVHEREALAISGLDDFWPVYPSRQQALEAVAG